MTEHISLIDTHAHLCHKSFDHDRDSVLRRARDTGVGTVIIVGETLADAERNIELAQQFPSLKPTAGLYPEHADLDETIRIEEFIRARVHELYGIGEVGLDFWLAQQKPDRELQREVFRRFIMLAKEFDLPLNVHSRSAGRHAVAMLLEAGATRVQLHGFDGKYGAALPAAEAGYFFSIPPSIVRSRQKQKLVKNLPLSCLLVESDSPVLGPDPETRNEPANILSAVNAIAEIKEITREKVISSVYENTRRLYGDLG